jgi:hypothetical protein
MPVNRTHVGHQTRYELRQDGKLSCAVTYTEDPEGPAIWKVLLPGPDGIEDVYAAEQFVNPDAEQLKAWLDPLVGKHHAAELTAAVDKEPPPPARWERLLRRPRSQYLEYCVL